MAHFLSDATHQRLQNRDDGETDETPAGVVHTHDFGAQIRCTEIATGGKSHSLNTLRVWTGDIDGCITVREGLQGKPIHIIEKKHHNVFVYALLCHGDTMWVGYSDGYLAMFNTTTYQKLFEVRAHSGAINAMILANDSVYTASSDWQIIQWDPVDFMRPCHSQLSGHQNAVRCLAADGNVLFSGGDDYAIRCWDLDNGLEKLVPPWPIVGHKDSVRALVLCETYLFSSSEDGTIKVWNIQTAQLVRQLDKRESAVNTLMLDPASNRVWSGSTDGTITIWDASSLNIIAEMNDHKKTHVAQLIMMARVNAVKGWVITDDGKIRVLYNDNDATELEFSALAGMELELQDVVESRRAQIIQNYKELENCKANVKYLEDVDRHRKQVIGEVFANCNSKELKRRAFSNSMQWNNKCRQRKQKGLAANMLQEECHRYLQRKYFHQLAVFARYKKELRLKADMSLLLLQDHDENIVRVYTGNMLEHRRRSQGANHRYMISCIFEQLAQNKLVSDYALKWKNFLNFKQLERKRALLTLLLLRTSERGLLQIYWKKMTHFVKRERIWERNMASVIRMEEGCQQTMRIRFYRRLQFNVVLQVYRRKRNALATCLGLAIERKRLHSYYSRWALYVKEKKSKLLSDTLKEQKSEIEESERLLSASAHLTEQQLEEELKKKQMELATILAANEEVDLQLEAATKVRRSLQRELLKDVSLDSNKPVSEQLCQAMYFLKSRGVSCGHDVPLICQVREEAKASTAEKQYQAGIEVVRKACATAIRPGKLMDNENPDWYIGDMFDKATQKTVEKACAGIVRMVTAYDMLNVGQLNAWVAKDEEGNQIWAAKFKHNDEVLANFGTLLEFALRNFRSRRNEDPLTGKALADVPEKKRPRSASPGGKKKPGSKSASRNPSPAPKAGATHSPRPKPASKPAAKRASSGPASVRPRPKSSGRRPKSKKSKEPPATESTPASSSPPQ